jgi:hypothetical protein
MEQERSCHLGQVSHHEFAEDFEDMLIESAVPFSTPPLMTMRARDRETELFLLERSRSIILLRSHDAKHFLEEGIERC